MAFMTIAQKWYNCDTRLTFCSHLGVQCVWVVSGMSNSLEGHYKDIFKISDRSDDVKLPQLPVHGKSHHYHGIWWNFTWLIIQHYLGVNIIQIKIKWNQLNLLGVAYASTKVFMWPLSDAMTMTE